VFDILKKARVGDNEISIIMHPMSIYAEIEPVYIMGDFDLSASAHGWRLVPQTDIELGSWKEQGLPFYSYDVAYSKTLSGLSGKKVNVRLGRWKGTVASVYVNGEKAGVIGWQPFELDITNDVKKGRNQIDVVVTGSFKNLLGPHHNVTRRGIVTPWSFKFAPEQQPQGADYDLYDYGLLDDFQIIVSEK
jgi:hypothetical protein